VDFKVPWNDPKQPNLLQLGVKFQTPMRKTVFETGVLVNTTSFPEWNGIVEDAYKAHGISELTVRLWGQDPQEVLNMWYRWAPRCSLFVGHNVEYDVRILQAFAFRLRDNPDVIAGAKTFCTMFNTRALCKIPSQHFQGFKLPKLEEAYKALVDTRGYKGAHGALADANASSEIFWRLVDSEIVDFKFKPTGNEMTDANRITDTVPKDTAPP